jgi:outer membrane protein
MKKTFLFLVFIAFTFTVTAQRYAYVDTKYILNNIPAYKAAQEKLNQLSFEWQEELEAKREQIDQNFQEYQSEKVLLTEAMKKKRQDEIMQMRKDLNELQRKYFGPEGELYKKRQELVKPIQEEVFSAIETIADKGNYAVIFDASNKASMLYTDPQYDKSDDVLRQLGYKK